MRFSRSASVSFGTKPLPPKPTAVAMLVVGLLLLSFAGYLAYSTYELQQNGIHTQGRVIKIERHGSSHFPVVTFTDHKNRVLTVRSQTSSDSYLLGDTIPVLYDPAKPLGAVVDEPFMLHLLDGIFAFLGIIFLLAALVVNRYLVERK